MPGASFFAALGLGIICTWPERCHRLRDDEWEMRAHGRHSVKDAWPWLERSFWREGMRAGSPPDCLGAAREEGRSRPGGRVGKAVVR